MFRNDVAVGGHAREFDVRVGRRYGTSGPVWLYESHVANGNVIRGRRLREPLASAVEWGPAPAKAIRAIWAATGERYEGKEFVDASLGRRTPNAGRGEDDVGA